MYTAFKNEFQVSHGMCERHTIERFVQNGIDPGNTDISSGPPDLQKHPELVAQYKAGKFA